MLEGGRALASMVQGRGNFLHRFYFCPFPFSDGFCPDHGRSLAMGPLLLKITIMPGSLTSQNTQICQFVQQIYFIVKFTIRGVACERGHVPLFPLKVLGGGSKGHRHRRPVNCLILKMYFTYINKLIKADFLKLTDSLNELLVFFKKFSCFSKVFQIQFQFFQHFSKFSAEILYPFQNIFQLLLKFSHKFTNFLKNSGICLKFY